MTGQDDDHKARDRDISSNEEIYTGKVFKTNKELHEYIHAFFHDWRKGLYYRVTPIGDNEIEHLIRHLIMLQEQSSHDRGRILSLMKDLYAKEALDTAAMLLSRTARWAIMHEIGMALSGTPAAVFRHSSDLTEDQILGIVRAGGHEHEISGASWPETDPVVARRALAAVVEQVLGFWRPAHDLAEALRALDTGEVRPILAPGGKGKHGAAYTLRGLRLLALLHVEFRRGFGDSEEDARHEVATAFGVSPETVSTWRKRLPVKEPGNQELLKMVWGWGDTLRGLSTKSACHPADEKRKSAVLAKFGSEALARIGSSHARALATGKRSRTKR